MDAVKLIRYTHVARHRYLKTIQDLRWEEVVEDRGTSFPSIKDIFMHTLDMEDRLVNYVIPGRAEQWAQQGWEKFNDLKSMVERVDEVEKKVDAYVEGITEQELKRKVHLPRRNNPPVIMTVEDVFLQVTIEAASHMGEFIAIMWQMDVQPPYLNWASFLEQTPNLP